MGGARRFYQFSAAHALLIGALPFYLPALLLQGGESLADISVFVALSGLSYSATLLLWDRLRAQGSYLPMATLSFTLCAALALAIVQDPHFDTVHITAVLYGAYGCFYWMTQRLLFVESSQSVNTGRRFGNAQILVTVLLKVGILGGGFLWERQGAHTVLVVLIGFCALAACTSLFLSWPSISQPRHYRIEQVLRLRDAHGSRTVFSIDGVFLFAESFFWVITLYAFSNHDLRQLGVLVVVLSALLAAVFYLIKNRLDAIAHERVYVAAVLGYAASWLLRGVIEQSPGTLWDYPLIVLIAFLTALFRLVFNKRFFDTARARESHFYIAAKSHWSQLALCAIYLCLAAALFQPIEASVALPVFYGLLVPLTLVYLRYRAPAGSR